MSGAGGDNGEPAGRVTIVDVGRRAGVSKSTVSLVLSRSQLIAEKTRDSVTRAMRDLGYVYHRGAASLRAASSAFVGMVMSDLTNPFFAELAAGIEDALYNLGFTPILANTNEDTERQARVLRSLREHNVAGIIMSPARGVNHLLALGHRQIGFLGADATMTTQQERVSGWRGALNALGVLGDRALIVEEAPTRAGGRAALGKVLELPRPPTAVVCYNDIVAMGATRELRARGLVPGRDMAVVGFDDIAEAEHNAPPLTTVNAETREMGRRCAQSLLKLIWREDPAGLSFAGRSRLVVRESCGAEYSRRMAS